MKFETHRNEKLLEAFLGFDFSSYSTPPAMLSEFLDAYGLALPRASKLQRNLHDDLACVLAGRQYQRVIETRRGPRLSGVASVDELLKKIEELWPRKPLLDYTEADRTVSILPVIGPRPEQRLYQVVFELLLTKRFWRMAVCKQCGKIFFGKKYCSDGCREAWHNKHTRAPAVRKKRLQEKEQRPKAKKARRKKLPKAKLPSGAQIFEEYKSLAGLEKLTRQEGERLNWLRERLTRPVKISLSYDQLPKQHRRQFDRIAQYS